MTSVKYICSLLIFTELLTNWNMWRPFSRSCAKSTLPNLIFGLITLSSCSKLLKTKSLLSQKWCSRNLSKLYRRWTTLTWSANLACLSISMVAPSQAAQCSRALWRTTQSVWTSGQSTWTWKWSTVGRKTQYKQDTCSKGVSAWVKSKRSRRRWNWCLENTWSSKVQTETNRS